MSLQIIAGERLGETITLEISTSVGRAADLSFDDPKMSKTHALFELDPRLGWHIKDNQSKNGVLINGSHIDSHILQEDDLIEIGSTQLRVVTVSLIWKPQLNQLLVEAFDAVKDKPLTVYLFRNIPSLNIIQGLQTGEKYILEYGPRRAGGESDDIPLFEPFCPDHAFEISADAAGVWFETHYPEIVLVNDTPAEKVLLKKGDQIRIHKTLIEVDFLNI